MTAPVLPATKPRLSRSQIWNMSMGFFGIQFGFALQNGNASRILQTFGAEVEHLPLFWLAAPLTGMIIQPIIGFYSDHTWTSLGRRKPYFLAGALVAAVALMFMPNADILVHILPALYLGAGILMIMDASFNVAMEPFRALVADLLPSDQRTLGFSVQTFLIGLGAVIGSWLPWVLTEWFGITREAPDGEVASNVTLSFYIGGIIFLLAILWTVFTTKEYFYEKTDAEKDERKKGLGQIFRDFAGMPKTMLQLGLVQFFSWFALFSMWVFTTAAVRTHVYGLPLSDTNSAASTAAGDWVSGMFGVYNGVAALYALLLPAIAFKVGRKRTHAISLSIGGLGLISIYFIHDPLLLVFSMIAIGIAWASILAMPYAILAGAIPSHKMGVYMGIFNFFITFPQIVNGVIGGPIVKYLYNSQAIYSIVMAGVFLLIAAFCVRFVDDKDDIVRI
ncbi:MAG TPA: MFS transporter [Ohtaekwangia sp.]|nr:MFS transporter [Ohtaekwangia sp.]